MPKIHATATVLFLVMAPYAGAQTGRDSIAILSAAVRIGAKEYVSSGAALAISPTRGKHQNDWPVARVAAWARSIGAHVASDDDAERCPAGKRSCYVPSKAEVMRITTPEFMGDSARVFVSVRQTITGSDNPHAGRIGQLWFVRKDGVWIFSHHGQATII
jgi:hypothetical protein